MVLLSMTREWPWGLVVLGDPEGAEELPSTFGDAMVVAVAHTLVSRIQHGIDGEATATAQLGAAPSGLLHVYSGHLAVVSGRVRLGDAANEQTDEVHLASGRYAVQVFVDEEEHPTDVRFVLAES